MDAVILVKFANRELIVSQIQGVRMIGLQKEKFMSQNLFIIPTSSSYHSERKLVINAEKVSVHFILISIGMMQNRSFSNSFLFVNFKGLLSSSLIQRSHTGRSERYFMWSQNTPPCPMWKYL
jgi:hypothetical protein